MKQLANMTVRIDIEEEAIRHAMVKHIVVTEAEVEAMVVSALERMDLKGELEKAVRGAVEGQVRNALHGKMMTIARREAARVVDELCRNGEERTG